MSSIKRPKSVKGLQGFEDFKVRHIVTLGITNSIYDLLFNFETSHATIRSTDLVISGEDKDSSP